MFIMRRFTLLNNLLKIKFNYFPAVPLLFLLPLLVLLVFYLSSAVKGYHSNYSSFYSLAYTVKVVNNSDMRCEDRRVRVLLPCSRHPFQLVSGMSMVPEPQSVFCDDYGNYIAEYIVSLKPRGELDLKINCKVQTFDVIFDVSEDNFTYEALADLNSGVGEVVADIIKSEDKPFYRLVSLYDYIASSFKYKLSESPKSLEQVLRQRTVQCCDGAVLFREMCRCAGLDAVVVSGFYISRFPEVFPQTHSWVLVRMKDGGWFPVDPALGRFDERSRCLFFGRQNRNYISMSLGNPQLGSVVADDNNILLKMSIKLTNYGDTQETDFGYKIADFPIAAEQRDRDKLSYDIVKAEMLLDLADSYVKSGKMPESVSIFEKLTGTYPDFLKGHKSYINFMFSAGLGDDVCKKYLKNYQRGGAVNTYCYAVCMLRLERYSEAEKLLTMCGDLDFINVDLYNSFAYLYFRTMQQEKGRVAAVKALSLNGDHLPVFMNIIDFFQKKEDWTAVIFWSRKAGSVFPEKELFKAQEAYAYLQMKKPYKAVSLLEYAVTAKPGTGWYHALLGWALRDLGQGERAEAELVKGIALKTGISDTIFYEKMLFDLRKKRDASNKKNS